MKVEISLASEYGIMFLHDMNAEPDIPKDAGRAGLSYTNNCIAFSVLTYVDGDAKIRLFGPENDHTIDDVFFGGRIICPSQTLSLTNHAGFSFINVPLDGRYADIAIYMSSENNPDVVECFIKNVDAYC